MVLSLELHLKVIFAEEERKSMLIAANSILFNLNIPFTNVLSVLKSVNVSVISYCNAESIKKT